jgi:hypothetical protein
MSPDSDLTDLLQLKAQLLALPEIPYVDRMGKPCRHPGGLYSRSLSNVLGRMRALTDTILAEAHPNALRQSWPATMGALQALFQAIDSYVDDLKTVVGAAAPSLPAKTRTQVCRQIDDVFEELVGRPLNRVRHNGETLESCHCHNPHFAVYGYFVSGARGDGVIAPSELAHGSSGTHWSFAVTVRRLLGQLVQAARMVYRRVRGTVLVAPSTWSEQERSDLRSIAAWLQHCAPYCFPNEAKVRVPHVELRGDEMYLRLDTLKKPRSAHSQPGVTWTRSFTGDGVSRQFAVV